MTLPRLAVLAALVLLTGPACLDRPALAAEARTAHAADSFDGSAQRRRVRTPTRVLVYPRRYSHPGPGAVRQCTSWLEPEYRPSGAVIVPRMRCWWVPG